MSAKALVRLAQSLAIVSLAIIATACSGPGDDSTNRAVSLINDTEQQRTLRPCQGSLCPVLGDPVTLAPGEYVQTNRPTSGLFKSSKLAFAVFNEKGNRLDCVWVDTDSPDQVPISSTKSCTPGKHIIWLSGSFMLYWLAAAVVTGLAALAYNGWRVLRKRRTIAA